MFSSPHASRPLAVRALASAALATLATLSAGTVYAQASGYSMTVLNKPGSTASIIPTSIDASGAVHGGAYVSAGYIFTNGGTGSCWICPQYTQQQAKWAAGTGTSVTGTLGTQGFVGVAVNGKGTQAGAYEPGLKVQNQSAFSDLYAQVPNTPFKLLRGLSNTRVGILRQGSASELPLPPGAASSTYYPFAFSVTALNGNDVLLVNRSGWSTVDLTVPYTFSDGQYTPLDTSVAQAGESVMADALNDNGLIVGHAMTLTGHNVAPDPATVRPVIWIGGRSQRLGGDELKGFIPVIINNAGQVVLQRAVTPSADKTVAALWFNGTKTAISSVDGREAYVSAMNDKGVVVGCLVEKLLYGSTETPFIWQNGVMQNLQTVVSSRGVQLPSGMKLGCPMAINNAGSILAHYYAANAPDKRTWVRLNAKP